MAEEFNTDDMLGVYLFENSQLLENLQEIVLEQKDEEYFDEDSINEIFRAMHTIKGSSAIMMFDDITKVAHKLEDVFYYLRESHPQNVPHVELVTYVLDVMDFIGAELEKIQEGEEADGDSSELIAKLDKFLSGIKGGGYFRCGQRDDFCEGREERGAAGRAVLYCSGSIGIQSFLQDLSAVLSGD